MSRPEARIHTRIWMDPGFVSLTAGAQRLYFLLLSQPTLSYCGVTPFTPGRWVKLASDSTSAGLEKAVSVLVETRFVLVDELTQELLVRTFVHHDGILDSPNLIIRMWKDLSEVFSPVLREAFLDAIPIGTAGHPNNPLANPSDNPSPNPSRKGQGVGGRGKGAGGKGKTGKPEDRISAPDTTPVGQVFDAWVESCGHTGRTRLDSKRRALITKALADYPIEDVLDAVRGWQHSSFHRGENPRGKVYNDLGLLLRDASHIEDLRDRWRAPSEPVCSGNLTNTRSPSYTGRNLKEPVPAGTPHTAQRIEEL